MLRVKISLNGPHSSVDASLSNRGLILSGPDALVTLRCRNISLTSCQLIYTISNRGYWGGIYMGSIGASLLNCECFEKNVFKASAFSILVSYSLPLYARYSFRFGVDI